MITIVDLQEWHFEAFSKENETKITSMPKEHIENGLAFILNKKPIAILAAWKKDKAAVLGLCLSDLAKEYPFALQRFSKQILKGILKTGYEEVHAHADNEVSRKWLLSLGFEKTNKKDHTGFEVYKKWR